MEDQTQSVIGKLLKRMDSGPGFAGLGASVQVISSIDGDDDEGIDKIVAIILRDAALTSKILRLANSSSRSSRNVASIDKAIALLGLNTVKSVAMSLALLDSMSNQPQSNQLHAEIATAYFCGTLASSLTRINAPRFKAQEAQVCGLMQNLGRMMALYYLYEDIVSSRALQSEKNLTEDAAVEQVLGMRFEDIGAAIAQHWNLPDVICQSLAPKIDKMPPRAAANSAEWLQFCSLFARNVTDSMFRSTESSERTEIGQHIVFFRTALSLRENETHELIEAALAETDTLLTELGFPCTVVQARSLLRKASERVLDVLSASDSLTKGDTTVGGKIPVEVIQQVLRLMHDELKFDLTLLCLPNGATALLSIAGVGRNANQVASKFRCHGAKPDIFRLVMSKQMDLYVGDVSSPAYAKYIPDWYQELVGARSFLIQSLVHKGQFLGMLYGDYTELHPTAPAELTSRKVLEWREQLLNVLLSDASNH